MRLNPDALETDVPIGSLIASNAANAGGGAISTPLTDAVIEAARKLNWMPINTGAALYKFAQSKNLGYPQTDEFEFTSGGSTYVGQVFNLGIVYVKKGDWGNLKWAQKPV